MKFLVSALALASAATACVKVEGKASTGVSVIVAVDLTDNGEKICGGHWEGMKDSGELSCKDGYKLTADFKAPAKPLHFTYETPHGTYQFLSDDPVCVYDNGCCGGCKYTPIVMRLLLRTCADCKNSGRGSLLLRELRRERRDIRMLSAVLFMRFQRRCTMGVLICFNLYCTIGIGRANCWLQYDISKTLVCFW